MTGHSFTAGADHRVFAATMTEFGAGSLGALRDIIASGSTTMLETGDQDAATGSASNKGDALVAIVDIDPERGAPEWNVIDGIGVFTGSFIIRLERDAAGTGSWEWIRGSEKHYGR